MSLENALSEDYFLDGRKRGEVLMYTKYSEKNDYETYIINSNGSKKEKISEHKGICWFPNGNEILLKSEKDDLYSYNINTKTQELLLKSINARTLILSPRGSDILLSEHSEFSGKEDKHYSVWFLYSLKIPLREGNFKTGGKEKIFFSKDGKNLIGTNDCTIADATFSLRYFINRLHKKSVQNKVKEDYADLINIHKKLHAAKNQLVFGPISPDGKKVINDDYKRIEVCEFEEDSNAFGVRRYVDSTWTYNSNKSFTWSDDSQRFAFIREKWFGIPNRLYVVNNHKKKLIAFGAEDVYWQPKNDKSYYARNWNIR